MEFPIRCFTCGRPIAQDYHEYEKMLKEGKTQKEALDALGVKRYCCRRMFISYVDLTELVSKYKRT
ncbi:DNA-directed RNA polymerase subunit N [Candidatus Micrarchaeota archaeon]|jgi:DNA-directed RNA polymerase subunit N (RpoN/RPB10)|nr:DNA-directed RNA polymerase subunit N [Candidatus Micrarchaeota archaeon]